MSEIERKWYVLRAISGKETIGKTLQYQCKKYS